MAKWGAAIILILIGKLFYSRAEIVRYGDSAKIGKKMCAADKIKYLLFVGISLLAFVGAVAAFSLL